MRWIIVDVALFCQVDHSDHNFTIFWPLKVNVLGYLRGSGKDPKSVNSIARQVD